MADTRTDGGAPPTVPRGGARKVPIRAKLAAALAVPLFAMGAVTLLEVVSVARDARDTRAQTKLATATIGPNGLINHLQNERNFAAADMVGVDSQLEMEATGYDGTRRATDTSREEFERELERLGDQAEAAYAPVLESLDTLDDLRAEVDAAAAASSHTFADIGVATTMFDRYTALIEPFFAAMSRISLSIDDPELREGAALTETTARMLETIPQLSNALALPGTVPTAEGDEVGINSTGEIAKLAQLQTQFRRYADTMDRARGRYAPIADEYFNEDLTQSLDALATTAIETGDVDIEQLISGFDVEGGLDQAYLGYRDNIEVALQDRADELNDAATDRQRTWALLLGATFVGAVALTVLASVSITRPLRSLTEQAREMAQRRLPNAVVGILDTPLGEDVAIPSVPPVQVKTRDEVADVADALNTVQDSALDLAVEQAVLRRNIADSFVNLGRRNQNLLGRQLDFITELESRETDPDTLASLFRLDHLATRMRRNAESLLVLAGVEPPRQWAAPVRVTDVIRAALGEVEDYQRVIVRSIEPATVVGSVAADLAHLLAELIENAISFSPHDRSVEVKGRRGAGGAADAHGYRLVVIDAGLGMPPSDIDAANRRLAGIESFTVAPSKYLGHYVAGNLAARHGIGVFLYGAGSGGITATVDLPGHLLTDAVDPQTGQPATAAPAAPTPPPAHPGAHRAIPTAAAGPTLPTGAQLATLERVAGPAPTPQQPPVPRPAPVQQSQHPHHLQHPQGQQGPQHLQAPYQPHAQQPGPSRPPLTPRPPSPAVGGGPTGGPGVGPAGGPGGGHAGGPGGGPAGRPGGDSPAPPLTRRTRGAQMPTTTPHLVRRARTPQDRVPQVPHLPQTPHVPPAPQSVGPPAGPAPFDTSTQHAPTHAASDVYGLLTNFTAGVQRGLDEVRGAGPDQPGR